jgi:hypothetical protein
MALCRFGTNHGGDSLAASVWFVVCLKPPALTMAIAAWPLVRWRRRWMFDFDDERYRILPVFLAWKVQHFVARIDAGSI